MPELDNAPQGPADDAAGPVPHQITKRVPDDQPLVLANSARVYFANRARPLIIIAVIFLLILVLDMFVMTRTAGPVGAALLAVAFLAVAGLGLFGVVWSQTSGGPTLAANGHGLWIRAAKTPAKAIWLPWSAIDQIYTRRVRWETALCVRPHNPDSGRGLGGLAAFERSTQVSALGAPFTASLTLSGRDEAEVLAALSRLADGRCRIG